MWNVSLVRGYCQSLQPSSVRSHSSLKKPWQVHCIETTAEGDHLRKTAEENPLGSHVISSQTTKISPDAQWKHWRDVLHQRTSVLQSSSVCINLNDVVSRCQAVLPKTIPSWFSARPWNFFKYSFLCIDVIASLDKIVLYQTVMTYHRFHNQT